MLKAGIVASKELQENHILTSMSVYKYFREQAATEVAIIQIQSGAHPSRRTKRAILKDQKTML